MGDSAGKAKRVRRIHFWGANGEMLTRCGQPPDNMKMTDSLRRITCPRCKAIMKTHKV